MYRILIADDEENIREGVAALIQRRCSRWEVVTTARDGREALELAKQLLPDAILTDISMPHMNGLNFLENLHDVLPEVKILVLSGYDQFEYAVQALRLGVSDYLLKPLETDKLLNNLDRIADELDRQAERWARVRFMHTQMEKAYLLEIKTYFRAALQGGELPALSPTAADFVAGSDYCCVLCTGMEGQLELLEDLLEQRLGNSARKVLLRMEQPMELAIVFWVPPDIRTEIFMSLNHALSSIAVHCRRTEGKNIHFYIGSIHDCPKRLRVSLRKCRHALSYAFPEHAEPVTAYSDVLESTLIACPTIPEKLMKDIPDAVKCGNRTAFYQNSQLLFRWFEEEGIRDATYMRMCILSLCFSILQLCWETEELSYYEFTNFQQEMMASRSLEELKTLFENFAQLRWLRQQKSQAPRRTLAERVAEVVQEHIANIGFSLDDVAAVLYISPNYLRQLFKQETGQTFTEYLTAQRMQRARMLLGNPKMRVSDAAELCGYADSRYFSVCFKKHWHMTPSEYQLSLQSDP